MNALAAIKEKAYEQGLPLHTVAVEVLHVILVDVLFSLRQSRVMALQGGTATHLLHGGYRYSEDLDFAGEGLAGEMAAALVQSAQRTTEKYVTQILGSGVPIWKKPPPKAGTRMYTAWFHFRPAEESFTLRVKMEFAQFPVYRVEPLVVHSEMDFLQRAPLINGLSPVELLAEKIAAVAGRRYLKGRDLFDLWYFSEVLQTELDPGLVANKFRDYGVRRDLSARLQQLRAFSAPALSREMERFLPQRHRQLLEKDGFRKVRRLAVAVAEKAFSLWQ